MTAPEPSPLLLNRLRAGGALFVHRLDCGAVDEKSPDRKISGLVADGGITSGTDDGYPGMSSLPAALRSISPN